MSDTGNRRRSYRLDDRMAVWIRPLEVSEYESIAGDFEQYRLDYSLKSHFVNQRELRQAQMQVVRKRDKDIAMYLEYLESQLIELAERLEKKEGTWQGQERQMLDINLSADGVRLCTDIELALDQNVELGLELPTDSTMVLVLARVVRFDECTPGSVASEAAAECGGREVSFDFTHIQADDTEAIIRHMARLQQMQLQARRS